MKKLLFILFLFIGFVAKSQVVVPRSPISIASQDARLYATFNLKIPVYADTTTANTYIGHDSVGLVFYNRADSNVYIRDLGLGAHRWKLLGPAGTGNVIDVFGRIGHVIALTGDYAAFYPVLSGSYTDPTWIASLAAGKIVGTQTVTPGSSKIILGGTPTGAAFQPFSIDIVPANILLSGLGGSLGIAQINATGAASSSTFLRGDGTWSSPGSTVTGLPNSWVGAGYRLTFNYTNNVRTLFPGGYILFDSTTNANGITETPDTSAGKLATKTDLTNNVTLATGLIGFGIANKLGSNASLGWDNTNKILKSSTANLNFNNSSIIINDSADATPSPDNIVLGFGALNNSTTSIGRNVAIGTGVMAKATNICCNVAVGYKALNNSTTGSNTAVGYQTLVAATTGFSNTAIGAASLVGLTTGGYNLDLGGGGLSLVTTGSHNTYIGVPSTSQIAGASYDNIIIGYQVSGGSVTRNNVTMIGDSLTMPANNTFLLGRKNQAIIIGEAGGNTALMVSIPQTTGALFYNTDSAAYCYFNGSNWIKWGTGGSGGSSLVLTTTGTSGVATLIGSTLNIPNYSAPLPPFSDANPIVKNSIDGSKQITISAVNLTTATNRTYTGPDVDGILVLNANTATLTNKTMSAASNTFSGFSNTNLSGTAGITNANLATMAAHTFKLNNTGGSAVPIDATATQATAELNIFTSGLKGLVPSSGGGTINFMRADGTWAAPPGSGGSDSAWVPQFGLAQTVIGTTKFARVDTAALYAAKISYFASGVTLGLINHDSVYLGGAILQHTHLSGSNNFNFFVDSATLTISKLAPGSRVMTDPTTDALTTQAELLHSPVKYATTGALAANTYANGTAGVGATLTGNSNGALAAQDGQAITAGDRILVKNEATTSHNGLYTVTQVGTGSLPYILTRGNYSSIAANMAAGSMVYIQTGTTLAGQLWAQTTAGTITFGTTALVYAAISGSGGSTTLNNKNIGFGNASNALTGESRFTYDSVNWSGSLFSRRASLFGTSTVSPSTFDDATFKVIGKQFYLGDTTQNAPTFLEFGRAVSTTGKAREFIGWLGTREWNEGYNLNYRNSVHQYHDTAEDLLYSAIGPAGYYLQAVGKGHSNYTTFPSQQDVYNTFGKNIFGVIPVKNGGGDYIGSQVSTSQINLWDFNTTNQDQTTGIKGIFNISSATTQYSGTTGFKFADSVQVAIGTPVNNVQFTLNTQGANASMYLLNGDATTSHTNYLEFRKSVGGGTPWVLGAGVKNAKFGLNGGVAEEGWISTSSAPSNFSCFEKYWITQNAAGSFAERMRLFQSGNLGIGLTTDNAAFLQTAANTTTNASVYIKPSAAVDVSSNVRGQLWDNGTNLYYGTGAGTKVDLLAGGGGMTNPMTTTGDIIYSSSGSTPARLPIGATNTVLTVTAGIPAYGPVLKDADYVPTLTNTTNITSATLNSASYTQVGNHIHVNISGTFNVTAGSNTASVMTFTLPVNTATTSQTFTGHGMIKYSGAPDLGGDASIASASTGTFNFLASTAVSCSFNLMIDYKIN